MTSVAREPARGSTDVAACVEELYRSHAALVRSLCRGLLRDAAEAEDAVQQTFLSAHRALANGSTPREPAAWLATIARNECVARVRANMRMPLPVDLETSDVAADTHDVAVRRQGMAELRDALAGLPAQQRDAILLREFRGLSYEEVAGTLSVTTSAVESLLFRARRTLQVRLREALAALSPGELLGRLMGPGGLVAPAAAKIVALGLGTAIVTGGAVLGPNVIGLGHAPATPRAHAAPATADRSRHNTAVPAAPSRPQGLLATHALPKAQDVVEPKRGDTSSSGGGEASQTESSDRQASSGGGDGESKSTSGTTSRDGTETTSSSTGDGGDVVETPTLSGDTGGLTDGSGSGDSGGTSDSGGACDSGGTGG
jgi:RNA polymerase sigma factor (sigma-70 family)